MHNPVTAFPQSPDVLRSELRGVCVLSLQGVCRSATPSFCRLVGCGREDVVGHAITSFFPSLSDLPFEAGLDAVRDRETTLPRRDGSNFPARVRLETLAAQGAATGFMLFVEDLTEEKHVEDLLRKSEKLASAGRMAAAIAHEINNPLEAVTNLLYLLRSEQLSQQAERYLSLLESEIERLSRIARQTLAFYREKGKPSRVDLRELLNMAVDLHSTRNSALRVTRRYRTSLCISGFSSELQQVFHNLVGNAIEAGATQIFLHTRACIEPAPPRRKGICITVGDNGSGIEPSIRSQLFHPFITTKGGSGTGLGLWTSRGIIVRHEGSINFRSSTAAGRSGTCFQIFLPRQ